MGFTLDQLVEMLKNHEEHKQEQASNPVKSKPKNQCTYAECKKKLLLSDPTCKCMERYCMSHRMPEDHACSFDYKAAGKALLTAANPKIDAHKVDKI